MPSSPIPGFITKSEAVETYQRSHRQLSRDLADAMKVQNELVLENCRLRTEDGEVLEGMGIVPEVIDRLRNDGKNPAWFLRASWLEKTYGRRGSSRGSQQRKPATAMPGGEKGSDASSHPDIGRLLRERIEGLERDKQDLRDELRIKNQQIADRVEREKETNALIRDLHTLMADLQRRLLPSPTGTLLPQVTDGQVESRASNSTRRDESPAAEVEVVPPAKSLKGSQPRTTTFSTTRKRSKRKAARRSTSKKKSPTRQPESSTTDATAAAKSRGFLSRLFSR